MARVADDPNATSYYLLGPPATNYNVIAFIDLNKNKIKDAVEASGSSVTLAIVAGVEYPLANISITGGPLPREVR